MQRVLILGGSTFDHIVHLPQFPAPVPQTIHKVDFHEACGSTGTGKALALTKLEVPNTLYTSYGNDYYGKQIEQFLNENNIQTIVIHDPAGTQRHINLMDAKGQRISMFVTQSSAQLNHDEILVSHIIDKHDVVVLNIIPYCRQLIPLLKKSGKPVWTDLHDYDGSNSYHVPFIDAADYIHMSSDLLPDYKPVMHRFINQGKKLVICTHGKQGADLLLGTGEWYHQPAEENIEIIDSNGAGDSFFSGFLFGFLQGQPPEACLKYGAICGALAVMDWNLVYPNLSPGLIREIGMKGFR
jgi:sugar/nucleoside kinase (ribokinase family)